MPDLAHHPKTIEYFVNGEVQETTKHKITVATILANAGFDPPTNGFCSTASTSTRISSTSSTSARTSSSRPRLRA
jgi:hypothetical protein